MITTTAIKTKAPTVPDMIFNIDEDDETESTSLFVAGCGASSKKGQLGIYIHITSKISYQTILILSNMAYVAVVVTLYQWNIL